MNAPSRYRSFDRNTWAGLRAATPLTLSEADVADLRGINDRLDLHEVEEVYLPLSRLLSLRVSASQELFRATDTFLGSPAVKVPYLLGVAGSVALAATAFATGLIDNSGEVGGTKIGVGDRIAEDAFTQSAAGDCLQW